MAVVGLALAVRIALVLATPGYRPEADPGDYDRLGWSLAGGHGFVAQWFGAPEAPTAFRPPGYPAVLAGVYRLTGHSVTAGRLAGALLGVAIVLLVYLLGAALWDRRVGWAASALTALFPPLVLLDASLLSETTFVALELAAALAVVSFRRGPERLWVAAAAGALLGLAALTRTNGMVLAVGVAVGLWVPQVSRRRRILAPAVALLAAALIVAPWTVRNAVRLHAFVPVSSQGGFTAAAVYNPQSFGDRAAPGVSRIPWQIPQFRALFAGHLDEVRVDGALRDRALGYALDHPLRVPQEVAMNAGRILLQAGPGHEPLAEAQRVEEQVPSGAVTLAAWTLRLVTLAALVVVLGVATGQLRARIGPGWLWALAVLPFLAATLTSSGMRYGASLFPLALLVAASGLTARRAVAPVADVTTAGGATAAVPDLRTAVSDRQRIDQAGEARSARIESLRAIAALGVLAAHACALAYGWSPAVFGGLRRPVMAAGGAGVFLFFVLSGYLLFWPFARRDFGGGDPVSLRRYARNRALRILPLYYVALGVLVATGLWNGPHGDLWRFALFLENFSPRTAETGDGPMWSLVVELHFYVLLPVLALALSVVARGSRRRAALVLGGLAAASLGLRLAVVDLAQPADVVWKDSLPTTLFLFATGMLLALLRLQWQEHRPRWLRGALASADAWLLAAFALWSVFAWKLVSPGSVVIVVPASFLLVAACVLPLRRGALLATLESRVLAAIGVASYSLYLLHVPVLDRLAQAHPSSAGVVGRLSFVAAAAGLSALAAAVGYALVERPFLRLRRSWSRSAPAPEPTSAAAPASIARP